MKIIKITIFTVLLSIFFICNIYSQDSLTNQSIKKINRKLHDLNYQMIENNQNIKELIKITTLHTDSLINKNENQLQRILDFYEKKSIDQIAQIINIKHQLAQNHIDQSNITKWQTIIIAIAIVMIALLIVITLQTRKNTISYLISETRKLSENQDEINEKADSLQKLSLEIAREILRQKKTLKKQQKNLKSSHETIVEKIGIKKGKKKK